MLKHSIGFGADQIDRGRSGRHQADLRRTIRRETGHVAGAGLELVTRGTPIVDLESLTGAVEDVGLKV